MFGSGIPISSGQRAYFISSTIADNKCKTATAANTQGHNLRIESEEVYMINSIVTSTTSVGNDIYIASGKKLTSHGGNIVGTIEGSFTPHMSDVSGKKPVDVFGTNGLADNGGYPKTIALATKLATTSLADIQSVLSAMNLWMNVDTTVDQRGVNRSVTAASSGAYEK